MPGRGKRYTPEFKEQAARKVVDNSLPIAQVARELGINDTTLGFWVKDYRKKLAGQPLPPDMPVITIENDAALAMAAERFIAALRQIAEGTHR